MGAFFNLRLKADLEVISRAHTITTLTQLSTLLEMPRETPREERRRCFGETAPRSSDRMQLQ